MKDTLRHNTMAGKLSQSVPMRKYRKSGNTLLARNRLREGYATDTIFSKVTSCEGYNWPHMKKGTKVRVRVRHKVVTAYFCGVLHKMFFTHVTQHTNIQTYNILKPNPTKRA